MRTTRNKRTRADETGQFTPRVTVFCGPSKPMWGARIHVELQDAKAGRPVVSIHPGGGGSAKAAEADAALFKYSSPDLRNYVKVGSSSKLDLVSNEGREHLRAICAENKGSVVTFAYESSKDPSTLIPLALREMQDIAKASGVELKVFACDSSHLRDDLEEFSDKFVEVLACEHDPGTVFAFATLPANNQLSIFSGKNYKMWQFKKGKSGELLRFSSDFVHHAVGVRFKQELRRHNWTYQEIADLFKVNASTVWREMQAVPAGEPVEGPISARRLAMFIELLNLKDPSTAKREDDDQLLDDEPMELVDDKPVPPSKAATQTPAKKNPAAKKVGHKR